MLNLPAETWLRFGIWMVIGVVVYFLYGRRHSRLGPAERGPSAATTVKRAGPSGHP